jgi:glycosyltransferase involved in cell wall biosynthesis
MGNGKNIHIVLIAGGDLYKEGGVKRHCWLLSNYLIGKGCKVTLYNHQTTYTQNRTIYYPFDKRIRIRLISLRDSHNCRNAIARQLRADAPDVVMLINCTSAAFIYALAIRKSGLPFLHSERGGPDHCLVHYMSDRQRELVFSAADYVHVLMPSYVKTLPKYIQTVTSAIPSQIEPANQYAHPEYPSNNGRFRILSSGRLGWEKDYDLLLRAFSQCADDFPDWELVIYGEGTERESLEEIIHHSNLQNRIFLPGRTADFQTMLNAYANAHIFVLPSRSEGCPMSLREAMAHGLPVIGFADCTGTNEIIHHDKDGLLLLTDDKVKRLEEGLRSLMAQPEKRLLMGKQAIQSAAAYEPQAIHERFEALLLQTARLKQGNRLRWHRLKLVFHFPWERIRSRIHLLKYGKMRKVRKRLILKNPLRSLIRGIWRFPKEYKTLYGRALFDPRYYLKNNLDAMRQGMDPLLHYIESGWKEGANPSSWFNSKAYIDKYLDGQATICPLYHYYTNGRFNGCLPMPKYTEFAKMPETIKHVLVKECKQEIHAVYRSWSWKMSAPLRFLKEKHVSRNLPQEQNPFFSELPH